MCMAMAGIFGKVMTAEDDNLLFLYKQLLS